MDTSSWPEGISLQSRVFLDRFGRHASRRTDVGAHAPVWAKDTLLEYEAKYGGTAFPILGGELQGWLRLGVQSGKIWESSPDEWIFGCAEQQFIQCAIVRRMDGYLGVSWSGEFLPWHAGVRQLIEVGAIWSHVVGWRRAAYCEGSPEGVISTLGELRKVSTASSAETAWWRGDGVAVYSEPYLTYARQGIRRVHVLVADHSHAQTVRQVVSDKQQSGRYRFVEQVEGMVEGPGEYPFD